MNEPRSRVLSFLWDILTKILLLSWPLLIGYNAWIVQKIHNLEMSLRETQNEVRKLSEGPRYTMGDAENLRMRILEQVNARMEGQLGTISAKLEIIQMSVVRVEERQRQLTAK